MKILVNNDGHPVGRFDLYKIEHRFFMGDEHSFVDVVVRDSHTDEFYTYSIPTCELKNLTRLLEVDAEFVQRKFKTITREEEYFE